MRIFLTGGSGLVGSSIRRVLERDGHELTAPSHQALDLTDAVAVRGAIDAAQPDVVIHAAGLVGGIEANRRANARFLEENLSMGLGLVGAAHETGVQELLNLASSCMYPAGHDEPLREDRILTGALEPTNEGYAIAKIAVTRYAQFLAREDPTRHYRTLIPCNLYGRGDSFDLVRAHLVPSTLRKVHEAKQRGERGVEIWGDGTARREFMYADDLAEFCAHVLPRLDALPELVNVGPGVDHTVTEYYEAAARVVGWAGEFRYDLTRPVGMQRKLLDPSLAFATGWAPRFDLDEGLRLTYEYFLEHAA